MTDDAGTKRICDAIAAWRIRVSSEDQAQADVEEALRRAGLTFEPQKRLTASDRLDVFCEGVAIEIKVKGSRPAILRQITRYAALPEVGGTVLVTGVAWPFASGEIGGKPFRAVRLSLGWL